mmetsp:Transcript_74559/g.201092  ORF Transcript_74559/g.201092 Transcript_74559/m.201092 type:complete len:273 (-) Transcript_74559:85-903(-)
MTAALMKASSGKSSDFSWATTRRRRSSRSSGGIWKWQAGPGSTGRNISGGYRPLRTPSSDAWCPICLPLVDPAVWAMGRARRGRPPAWRGRLGTRGSTPRRMATTRCLRSGARTCRGRSPCPSYRATSSGTGASRRRGRSCRSQRSPRRSRCCPPTPQAFSPSTLPPACLEEPCVRDLDNWCSGRTTGRRRCVSGSHTNPAHTCCVARGSRQTGCLRARARRCDACRQCSARVAVFAIVIPSERGSASVSLEFIVSWWSWISVSSAIITIDR